MSVKTDYLKHWRIADLPAAMYYFPDFITEDEERHLTEKIPRNRWITLSHRRLQAIPARLTANNTLLPSPLPAWLTKPIADRISALGVFNDAPHGINHCLINEYLPGQGIMPHEDGASYFPVVATISLGGSIVLDVTEKLPASVSSDRQSSPPKGWRILQEPRSLLLTTGAAYTDTLHGIAEVFEDGDLVPDTVVNWTLLKDAGRIIANEGRNERATRISLTFRDVYKVSGVKLFGKPK